MHMAGYDLKYYQIRTSLITKPMMADCRCLADEGQKGTEKASLTPNEIAAILGRSLAPNHATIPGAPDSSLIWDRSVCPNRVSLSLAL